MTFDKGTLHVFKWALVHISPT